MAPAPRPLQPVLGHQGTPGTPTPRTLGTSEAAASRGPREHPCPEGDSDMRRTQRREGSGGRGGGGMSLALWAPWVCLLGEGQTDRASSLHNRRFPEKGQRIQRHKRLLCCCPAAVGSCQSPQEPRELLGSPCYQPPAPLRGRKNGAGTIPARRHVPLARVTAMFASSCT